MNRNNWVPTRKRATRPPQLKRTQRYWDSRAKNWHLVRTREEMRSFRAALTESFRMVRGTIVELMSGSISYIPRSVVLDRSIAMLTANPKNGFGRTIPFDLESLPDKRLPFKLGSVGGFALANATQYLRDPATVFRYLRPYLQPNGKLVLLGSDNRGTTGHELNQLDSMQVKQLLEKEGFVVTYRPVHVFYDATKTQRSGHKSIYFLLEARPGSNKPKRQQKRENN